MTLKKPTSVISVCCQGLEVGLLKYDFPARVMQFEYSTDWLQHGFAISPFRLPLENKFFRGRPEILNGNFGVFEDSLPDAWGQKILRDCLARRDLEYLALAPLDRLRLVGSGGRGALEYYPEYPELGFEDRPPDLETLAEEARILIEGRALESLDEWRARAGSSGGARPKVHIPHEGRDWIVKFRSQIDPPNIGAIEYQYALTAVKAGIEMPPVKLFEDKYFGILRFDRGPGGEKVMTLSAAGLLEKDFSRSVSDYSELMSAAFRLTRDYGEVSKVFRLMCFNILARNRDDHLKNFAFIRDGDSWRSSPAYDLTPSPEGMFAHALGVAGKRANVKWPDVLRLARQVNLDAKEAGAIWDQVTTAVREDNLLEFVKDLSSRTEKSRRPASAGLLLF